MPVLYIFILIVRMWSKKKEETSSSNVLTALIGLGIGAVGGFLLNKFLNEDEKKEP
jgi:L-cystine uptake protein TcyP (sodium:dicarboxylate symporter family)